MLLQVDADRRSIPDCMPAMKKSTASNDQKMAISAKIGLASSCFDLSLSVLAF